MVQGLTLFVPRPGAPVGLQKGKLSHSGSLLPGALRGALVFCDSLWTLSGETQSVKMLMSHFSYTKSRTEEMKSRDRERQSHQLDYYKERGCEVNPQGASLAGKACDLVPCTLLSLSWWQAWAWALGGFLPNQCPSHTNLFFCHKKGLNHTPFPSYSVGFRPQHSLVMYLMLNSLWPWGWPNLQRGRGQGEGNQSWVRSRLLLHACTAG